MARPSSNEATNGRLRPLGVWILSGLAILLGLYPIVQLLITWQTGEDSLFSLLTAFDRLAVAGGLGLIVAAIGAWLGNNHGRLFLLALIVVFAFVLATVAFDESFEAGSGLSQQLDSLPGAAQLFLVLIPVLLVVVYMWYFNRPAIKAYYKPAD